MPTSAIIREFGAQGAVNLPVSDTFAARVALYGTRRDGFYNITGPGGAKYTGNNGDQRQIAGRISLLWKPTPQLTILSKTDLDYLDFGAYSATPFRKIIVRAGSTRRTQLQRPVRRPAELAAGSSRQVLPLDPADQLRVR